jgi:hypothetical protein
MDVGVSSDEPPVIVAADAVPAMVIKTRARTVAEGRRRCID